MTFLFHTSKIGVEMQIFRCKFSNAVRWLWGGVMYGRRFSGEKCGVERD